MKKLILLLLFISLVSCSPDEEKELPFYVAENGVTIKVRDWVAIGRTGNLNGLGVAEVGSEGNGGGIQFDRVYYTAVDLAYLQYTLNTYSDLSTLVTSKVKITSEASAKGLFSKTEIKGMENWDVSNWTSMYGLFDSDKPIKSDLSYWDVSKATNMSGFFSTSSENRYIEGMDLSGWDVTKVTTCNDFFGSITNWPESKKPHFTNCNPN